MFSPPPLKPFAATSQSVAPSRLSLCLALLAGVLLFAVAGCALAGSKPGPLTPAAVEQALQAPSFDLLRVEAAKITHPLLQPLTIDGRDGFSPDEIALMAVLASPQLRALRDQRGVAQAQVLQAGILPNPQLGYTLDRPSGNADPSLITGKNLGLSWDFTALLNRADRVAGAKATAGALDLAIAWQEWQTAQGARLNAFHLLGLQKRLPLVRQIEGDLADNLAAIREAANHGLVTAPDLTLATDLWITAQNTRMAAEQEERSERSALNFALGLPTDYRLPLKPAVSFPPFPPDLTPASLLQGLETRRLDLVALTLGYESNEAAIRAAVIGQFPRIGLSFAKANDTSNVRTHTFGLTVDLPIFDRNQGAIAAGKATRQQLFDEYVARVAEARANVVSIFNEVVAATAQVQSMAAALPDLEKLVAASAKAFETRNIDVATYRDARAALASRRLQQVELEQKVLDLEVGLEIATGRPLLNLNPHP